MVVPGLVPRCAMRDGQTCPGWSTVLVQLKPATSSFSPSMRRHSLSVGLSALAAAALRSSLWPASTVVSGSTPRLTHRLPNRLSRYTRAASSRAAPMPSLRWRLASPVRKYAHVPQGTGAVYSSTYRASAWQDLRPTRRIRVPFERLGQKPAKAPRLRRCRCETSRLTRIATPVRH